MQLRILFAKTDFAYSPNHCTLSMEGDWRHGAIELMFNLDYSHALDTEKIVKFMMLSVLIQVIL